ncbi:MAG: penicillin-binding protein 2 [Thermoleophilia bacterium]|nr:penicillin-binding protein 2 [Thermoleophilia bacterium]
MNGPITRLAVTAVVLLGALIVGTTYWQVWAAPALADRQDNAIERVAEFTVKRGRIVTRDGTVLAVNNRRRVSGKTFYFRDYPQRDLASHLVGYSTQGRARAGLERSLNDYLTGANSNLGTVLATTLDRLRGATIEGNDLVVTLHPHAQRTALAALGSRCGSIVVLEPGTGRVLVLASTPTYDANRVEDDYEAIRRIRGQCQGASALLNRATAGLYAPGSTFKVVTGAAALDTPRYSLASTFYDPGFCTQYGRRVSNYDTSRPFGRVNFVQAMQYSINSVFCNLGKDLGGVRLLRKAREFGFYDLPPLETPADERAASGLYRNGRPFFPENDSQVDAGRLAFGQERLLLTPLQLAMVTAGVANGGVVMEPQSVERVVSPDGKRIAKLKPRRLERAMDRGTARSLTIAMRAVVASGTGTAAQIPGVSVAGKTGTAETGRAGVNTTSFVAFAPVERPRVAIAVVLEAQRGTGGTTAAPLAKTVMQALLRGGRTS